MATKPPMTGAEACDNIAAMRAKTRPDAQRRLLELALGGLGNLSDEAHAIYRDRLTELQAGEAA